MADSAIHTSFFRTERKSSKKHRDEQGGIRQEITHQCANSEDNSPQQNGEEEDQHCF